MPITTIELPHVGESVTEGIIGKWLKQPGDTIEKYEPLVEVVTDKVNMEVPAPFSGTLTDLLVAEGDTVLMGAAIARMDTEEAVEAPAATTPPPASQTPTQPIGRTGVLLKDVRPVGPTGSGEEPPMPDIDVTTTTTTPSSTPTPAGSTDTQRERKSSPVVRRLAAEYGVDMAQVAGTGMNGRVTREDVLRYVEERAETPAPPTAPSAADEEAVALSPLRRIIAENMVKSATQIPQVWSLLEVDVTSLVAFREGEKNNFLEREGVALTYLPFVLKALSEALREHPMLNSSWGGDRIILKKRINVGIAVAAPQGLVVPVIHDADKLTIAGLAHASRDIALRARDNKLVLEDVHGGTFTLNNTGALGSVMSQPLVNPPQAAILTTEAIVKRPVVMSGDAIAVRSMMNICVTFDHRILDGAETSTFMDSVKRRLESVGPDTQIY